MTLVAAAAFVIGRMRVGDWRPRRDVAVVIGCVGLGIIGVALASAPPVGTLVVLPVLLALCGAYLVRQEAASLGGAADGRRIKWIGGGALVAGIFGLLVGIVRLAS